MNAVDLRPSILTEAPPHCRGVYLHPQCSVAFSPQTHFHITYLQKKEKKETQVVLVCDLALTRHWSETAAIGTLHRMEVYSACLCTLTEFALTHEDWPQQSTTYTSKADFIWRGSWAKLEFQPSPCETRPRRGSLVESNWPWVSQRGRVPPHGRVLWPHTLIWCLRGKSKIYKWKKKGICNLKNGDSWDGTNTQLVELWPNRPSFRSCWLQDGGAAQTFFLLSLLRFYQTDRRHDDDPRKT